MLIILEGRDKTGKTYLYNKLKEIFKDNKNVKFFTPTFWREYLKQDPEFLEKSFYGDWVLLFDFLKQITDNGNDLPHIIMDRSFISEIIYGPASRPEFVNKNVDWWSQRVNEYTNYLSEINHLIIWCDAPLVYEDDKWDKSFLEKINKEYFNFFNKVMGKLNVIYCYSLFRETDFDDIILKLKEIL